MPIPIRLLVADHQILVRACLVAVLNRRRNLKVVGQAATGDQALGLARTLQPDVAVLEPALPEGGAELVAALGQVAPACRVLVLTQGFEGGCARRLLQAGARGYLTKRCEPREVVQAIELVRAGELVVAHEATAAILAQLASEPASTVVPTGLTERELEVLQLVAQGHSNPEIARRLTITEYTVKGHLSHLLDKLALANRVQLAAYALEHGLAARTPVAAWG